MNNKIGYKLYCRHCMSYFIHEIWNIPKIFIKFPKICYKSSLFLENIWKVNFIAKVWHSNTRILEANNVGFNWSLFGVRKMCSIYTKTSLSSQKWGITFTTHFVNFCISYGKIGHMTVQCKWHCNTTLNAYYGRQVQ